MSSYNIGRSLSSPPDEYDDSERVASSIAAMSYSELRDEVALYHLSRALCGGARPYGYRFGEWLRDQISTQLAKEDRESLYD